MITNLSNESKSTATDLNKLRHDVDEPLYEYKELNELRLDSDDNDDRVLIDTLK